MYYPEANVLVPRDVDPQSKTPAFKSVLVEVVPDEIPRRAHDRVIVLGFDCIAGQTEAPRLPLPPAKPAPAVDFVARTIRVFPALRSPRARTRPPRGGGRGGGPPQEPRDYRVTAISGVVADGQRWRFLWQEAGNNGDGIVGTDDGGLLIAQNDNSDVVKLDANGRPSVVYSDTHTGGSFP